MAMHDADRRPPAVFFADAGGCGLNTCARRFSFSDPGRTTVSPGETGIKAARGAPKTRRLCPPITRMKIALTRALLAAFLLHKLPVYHTCAGNSVSDQLGKRRI